jgi:hypothetical protein
MYIMFCLFLVITMRARGYGNCFNDFTQINWCMGFASLLWALVLLLIITDNHSTASGRVFKTALILLLTQYPLSEFRGPPSWYLRLVGPHMHLKRQQ